jgi:hypothetical protein
MALSTTKWEKYAAESRVYGFDFAANLDEGETITAATWSIAIDGGASVPAMLSGSSSSSGSITRQRIVGGTVGTLYQVTATATTSAGNTLVGRQLLLIG